MSIADEVMEIAREVQPELYETVEAVAKIIDPAAFQEAIVIPESEARRFTLRQKYMQATAMRKAHEVLTYLGVNTDTDWYEILSRLTDPASSEAEEGE